MVTAAMKLKHTFFLEESYDRPRQPIKKQRHHFANQGPYSQSYGFSNSHLWMWELDSKESWEPKNYSFELWCWRRLLRVTILKEISPDYSVEGLMLKLKFQYFSHLMRRNDSLEKIVMLGKIEGKRRMGRQRMRWLNSITDSVHMIWANSRRW